VTKTTSVHVAIKRLIERYVIYRDIFQNVVKYFELIISIYMISRML
jgi:small-conductance mechanosensitive channel